MFPADNPWNQDVSGTALNAMSATYLAAMNPTRGLHPDWGSMTDGYGIPFSSGTGAAPQPMTWTESWGSTESDMLPCATGSNKFCYPIPLTAPIEGGPTAPADWDRHVLYVDTAGGPGNCTLYELYNAQNPTGTRAGRPRTARSSTSDRTRCAPMAGLRRTPPGCRSFRGSCGSTRSWPARSSTPSGSP